MSRCLHAFIAALTLVACAGEEGYRPLRTGDPAPAYSAPRLGGDTVSLASLRGRPVLLNVWATWCAPCRDEMPALQALQDRYAGRLHVLGASIDSRGAEDAVHAFLRDHRITFMILHDADETVSRLFRINGVPETFLIDADGTIAHRWIGAIDPLGADVIAKVDAALR